MRGIAIPLTLTLSIGGCKSQLKAELTQPSESAQAASDSPSDIVLTPVAAKPGETVAVTGKNLTAPAFVTIDQERIGIQIISSAHGQFVMPNGVKDGIHLVSFSFGKNEVKDIALASPGQSGLPVFSGTQDHICSDEQYINATGQVTNGTKICHSQAPSAVPACTEDGQVGCLANATFVAVRAASLVPGNIKNGILMGGTTGAFPSPENPLPGTSGSAFPLTAATFDARIKSNNAFEYWDASGMRHETWGDADLAPENIKNAVNIFGSTGNIVQPAPPPPWDLKLAVTVGTTTGLLRANCRNAVNQSKISMGAPFDVTIDDTTDIVAAAGHGLANDTAVRFTAGSAPGGITADTVTYYVINATGAGFQIATAVSGPAVDLTSTGGSVVAFPWNDTTPDWWDTVEDLQTVGGATPPHPWSAVGYTCGGLGTEGDDTVWIDRTTGGCTSGAQDCKFQDRISGLEWTELQSIGMSWGKALTTCNDLIFAGSSDWRLPTQKELLEAYTHGISTAATTNWITGGDYLSYFWSSTSLGNFPGLAWALNLGSGNRPNNYTKNLANAVTCVH